MKKTICVDFDGVIHRYRKGWQNGSIYDKPVSGALNFIMNIVEKTDYDLVILSSRASDPNRKTEMIEWLKMRIRPSVFEQLVFTDRKVPAVLYIDDRGFRFEGTFPTIDEIRDFERTWCQA